MPETAAQREERRRRAAELAVMRFDEFDSVRLMRHRRALKDAGRVAPRSTSRVSSADGRRAALEAYARNNGLTMAELDRIRAAEAVRRGAFLIR